MVTSCDCAARRQSYPRKCRLCENLSTKHLLTCIRMTLLPFETECIIIHDSRSRSCFSAMMTTAKTEGIVRVCILQYAKPSSASEEHINVLSTSRDSCRVVDDRLRGHNSDYFTSRNMTSRPSIQPMHDAVVQIHAHAHTLSQRQRQPNHVTSITPLLSEHVINDGHLA